MFSIHLPALSPLFILGCSSPVLYVVQCESCIHLPMSVGGDHQKCHVTSAPVELVIFCQCHRLDEWVMLCWFLDQCAMPISTLAGGLWCFQDECLTAIKLWVIVIPTHINNCKSHKGSWRPGSQRYPLAWMWWVSTNHIGQPLTDWLIDSCIGDLTHHRQQMPFIHA